MKFGVLNLSLGLHMTALAILGSITGCVAWPDGKYRPEVPRAAKLPFVDQVWSVTKTKAEKEKKDWPRPLTLNDYKDVLRDLLRDVMAASELKNDQFWDSGMTTLIGGTAATLGSLSSVVGLTNTGLAVAASGQLGKTYYSPQQTRDLHLNAHAKLSCISTELGTLSESQRRAAIASGALGSKAAGDALTDTSHAVDSILNSYRRTLLGMAPQVSTREDLLRFATTYQAKTEQADKAAAAAAAGGDPEEPNPSPTPTAPTPQAVASAPVTAASAPQAGASSPAKATKDADSQPKVSFGSSEDSLSNEEWKRYLKAGPRYAARFVDFNVKLEACTKGPISQ